MRFILRDEGGPIRERLQRGLVEHALRTGNPDHAMTAETIRDRIIHFGSLPDYPLALVTQGLNQLIARGDIHTLAATDGQHRLYRLKPPRFRAVDRALSDTEAQERRFHESVVRRLEIRHGALSRDDKELIECAFSTFVGKMLGALGERCAHRLIEERSGTQVTYPSLKDDLETVVRGLPLQLQEDARHAFEDVLRHPSEDESAYLYSAGQVFYIAELLNIDPELQNLQRGRFETTTLFLDTNLLLALVNPKDDAHDAVTGMISLCRAVNLKTAYTERTAEEFDALITAADTEYRATPPFAPETAAEFAPLVENPILRGWLESFGEHKAAWPQYRTRVGAWRNVLSNLDVNLFSLQPISHSDGRFQQLKKLFTGERRTRRGEARSPKRPRAVEHDAEVVASIESLVAADQAEPNPFGPRFWFITRDRHLVDCARSSGRSVAMLAEEWVQYIAPFLGPDMSTLDAAATFTGLLSSRFFPSLGQRMTLADLRLFTEPKVAELTAGLSTEDACRAVADAHLETVTRTGNGPRDDAAAIARLAELAERKIKARIKTGQLVEAGELDRLRSQRQADIERAEASSIEQAKEIDELKEQLAATSADQKTSVGYWWRRISRSVVRVGQQLRAWKRAHPRRVVLFAVLFIAVCALEVFGLNGLLLRLLMPIALIVPALDVNLEQVKKNVGRLFG
jgi:hypothetical protein